MAVDKNVLDSLNRSLSKTSSWKELFAKINFYLLETFNDAVKSRFCKHNYEHVETWTCDHTDNDRNVLYTTRVQAHQCPKCLKRVTLGELNRLTVPQQDWLKLWIKHEIERH